MKVVTSRTVKKGEELCDNYGSSWGGGQGLRERRKALAADYGFSCTCIACAAEERDAKRNLTLEEKEQDENGGHGRQKTEYLDDLWKEQKRNQASAWKGGNIRMENLGK